MTSSDEDEDLKRAIQLSLQASQQEVINLDSDSETTTDDSPDQDAAKSEEVQQLESAVPAPAMGIPGLDRKAMEQERLLRRKRKASISPPPVRKSAKMLEAGDRPFMSTPENRSYSGTPTFASETKLPYINGAVKKTWAFGHARDNDIKLEEVLEKKHLALAVLSSFQWDVEWLLSKISTRSTQLVFVMQADTDEVKAQYRRETAAMPNLRLCFPSMEGQINCMHSKLMLLSYPTHLRIVVPTANLVPYDWGETGVMENTVFLIDLPRLPDDTPTPEEDNLTDFGKDLLYFLRAMGLDQSISNSTRRFDFSATNDLAFVHTVGGAHHGDANEPWRRTGYCGLGRAITNLGLATSRPIEIDYVTSSVGSLNIGFLSMLHLAAQGDDGLTEHSWRTQTKKDSKAQAARTAFEAQTENSFRVFYPSEETVKASTGGPENAGTICFQPKWWTSPTFPTKVLRDCKSRRRGLLMHNKIIFAREKESSSPEDRPPRGSKAWVYVGSANCSESAWGRLVKDKGSKGVKLNCRNWECGVVVPLRRAWAMGMCEVSRSDGGGKEGLEMFRGVLPIPMEYPGEVYGGDRKPWFYGDGRG
ncbi:MAG: hypothetical protein Q9201_007546 [Fulgogasparrea decipioides]